MSPPLTTLRLRTATFREYHASLTAGRSIRRAGGPGAGPRGIRSYAQAGAIRGAERHESSAVSYRHQHRCTPTGCSCHLVSRADEPSRCMPAEKCRKSGKEAHSFFPHLGARSNLFRLGPSFLLAERPAGPTAASRGERKTVKSELLADEPHSLPQHPSRPSHDITQNLIGEMVYRTPSL